MESVEKSGINNLILEVLLSKKLTRLTLQIVKNKIVNENSGDLTKMATFLTFANSAQNTLKAYR